MANSRLDINGDALLSGREIYDRRLAGSTSTLTASRVFLAGFTAEKDMRVSSLVTYSGATAATGATLAKVGLYEVDKETGNLTLIASCANDTALWSVATT